MTFTPENQQELLRFMAKQSLYLNTILTRGVEAMESISNSLERENYEETTKEER